MTNLLQFLTVFLFSTFLIFGQSECTPIPEVNFPGGRVVMSFDGNVHDDDDIIAMAYSAGLWWAAGLQDKVVQIEYNNHVCSINEVESDGVGPGKGDDSQNMRNTAAGAISNFGYRAAIFYDYERVASASTNKMAQEIEKSTTSNPLWIIAAGPMETVWRGLEKAKKGHGNVTIISHSIWNQDHTHCNGAHNWADVKNKYKGKGVFFVENCKSNCNSASALGDQNKGFRSPISNWTWMKNSDKAYNRWIFSRNPWKVAFDPSDAGMSYYLITGGPFNGGDKSPDHNDARKLMENPCQKQNAPKPGNAPSLTITNPSENQVFEIGKEVTVRLNASDDGTLVKHQIFINNVSVDTDGSSYSPHVLKILKKETYNIRAEVTDNSGKKSTKTVTITGGEDNTDKTPQNQTTSFDISSPADGEVFKSGETILVNLTSNNTAIKQHKIFVNNKLVDSDGARFTPHRITNAKAGSYSIRGQVTDNKGKVSTKIINITVGSTDKEGPKAGSPDFNFSSPTDGQNFKTAADIVVKLATKGATNQIVKHRIFVNNKLVDTDGTKFSPHTIANVKNGIYVIKAEVTNRNGNNTIKSITVKVSNGNSSKSSDPITLSMSPADGKTFNRGNTVIVTMSASSNSGTIVKHQIFVDGLLVDTDGPKFTRYTINNITKGDHIIKVEVTDASGNKKSMISKIKVRANSSTSLVAKLSNGAGGTVEKGLSSQSSDEESSSMRIAQNPVQSANLKIDLKSTMDLTIIDLNGKVIKEIKDAKDNMNVDVSGLVSGMYILKSATETAKFIIPLN